MEALNLDEETNKKVFFKMLNIREPTPDEMKQNELYEKQEEENLKLERFRKSGVGKKYLDKTLDDFVEYNEETKSIKAKVVKFINDVSFGMNRSMWFCGKCGNGKTFLASMIIRECGGHFCKSYEIDDSYKDAMSFSAKETRSQVLKRYADYSLLVIDEVGRFQSQTEVENLFKILNERYEAELPTIIITNMSKEELKKYIGLALYDRFVETCSTVEFNSESYRKNERK